VVISCTTKFNTKNSTLCPQSTTDIGYNKGPWTDLAQDKQEVAGSYEHGNESSGSRKYEDSLEQLRNH
jgi:hypothetical protein